MGDAQVNVALRTMRLSDIADLNPGLAESLSGDAIVSFVPMAAVTAKTASTTKGEDRRYAEVSKGYTPFLDGDLLVAKITPCWENGKIAQARLTHRIGFGSTEFHVVRPNARSVDARYLLHFLRQERVRGDGERKMTGSGGQRRVPEHFLAGLQIPVPPLPEQRRIAEVLDRAEALRAKRCVALAQLDTLTQSIFLEMFGDPTTNPKGWPEQKLSECTERIQIGPFGSLLHEEDYVVGGVPLINPKHIRHGAIVPDSSESVLPEKHAELSLYHLWQGDVIMGRRGEMGRCAIVGAEHAGHLCGTGSLFLRPNLRKATPLYLAAMLSSSAIRLRLERLSLGATLPNLNRAIVAGIRVHVPPLSAQTDFARRVDSVERLRSAHHASSSELDSLFSSLQHRAFRGEL